MIVQNINDASFQLRTRAFEMAGEGLFLASLTQKLIHFRSAPRPQLSFPKENPC